jgi:DNA gyrase subunit B
LFPSLTLTLINRRAKSPRKKVFHYEDGLSGYLYDLRGSRKGLHPPIRIRAQEPFKYETWGRKETLILAGQVEVDLCFQLTYPGRKEAIKCFTNTWPNPLGGTHLKGLKLGIVQALNLELPDLPDRCLAAVISIYHPVPSFEYSTKDQLASPEVKDLVERKVLEAFTAYLNSENGLAEKIATELRPSKEV